MVLFSSIITAGAAAFCNAQSTFDPLRPPAIPLAVRSPYMSIWQQAGSDGGNGGYLAGEWPTFWAGQVTGWEGLIKVDNETYQWMGADLQTDVFANQTAFEYTSTRSIFTLDIGGLIEIKVTFLSPVTPNDLLRMSLPVSYMDVAVSSLDGESHNVQLYTDISAEWVSGDHSATAQWEYDTVVADIQPLTSGNEDSQTSNVQGSVQKKKLGTKTMSALTEETVVPHTFKPFHGDGQGHRPTNFRHASPPEHTGSVGHYDHQIGRQSDDAAGDVAYHRIWRQEQLELSEINQQANWGFWYYSTEETSDLTHQSGSDADVRSQFIQNGKLANTEDSNFRAIDDAYPVFGFARDLGQVGEDPKSALFMISLHQETCINFEGANGNMTLPCMWTNYFDSETDAVYYFYADYSDVACVSDALDAKVYDDSVAADGEDYASLTSLAVRQAFGALAWVNTPSEPLIFMKEISSNGDIQTVDVIFPFHLIALYMNPDIIRYLLDPLFINQEAGWWPYVFSIHDLGIFPNATGHNDGNAEQQPLEECGNMLIMTLAYYQRTQDKTYLTTHYDTLKQWNQYLVEEALIPQNQISTDDFAGSLANQTNLALKGIIGIQAMAQIANITGNVQDGQNYSSIAHDYITQWMDLGIAQTSDNFSLPHTTLAYGMNDTYNLLYNLYADRELGLELVPQSVHDMQSEFYPGQFERYGVPLDTRHSYTKNDWEMFCAAVASTSTKDRFISTIATWLDETVTNFAFGDWYDAITGDYTVVPFIARPVVGGMFSILALNSAPTEPIVEPA